MLKRSFAVIIKTVPALSFNIKLLFSLQAMRDSVSEAYSKERAVWTTSFFSFFIPSSPITT